MDREILNYLEKEVINNNLDDFIKDYLEDYNQDNLEIENKVDNIVNFILEDKLIYYQDIDNLFILALKDDIISIYFSEAKFSSNFEEFKENITKLYLYNILYEIIFQKLKRE